jgi:hypothetical protein
MIGCYFDELALQNKLQEIRKRKENRDEKKSSSKIRLQKNGQPGLSNANIQSFVVNMRWKEPSSLDSEDCDKSSLVETGEENSGGDAECLYCSGLYTRDRRGEKWIKCTNATNGAMKNVQVQTTGKTFPCFFCNTE